MKQGRCGSEKCRGQSRIGAYGVMARRSNHGKRGLYNGKLKAWRFQNLDCIQHGGYVFILLKWLLPGHQIARVRKHDLPKSITRQPFSTSLLARSVKAMLGVDMP